MVTYNIVKYILSTHSEEKSLRRRFEGRSTARRVSQRNSPADEDVENGSEASVDGGSGQCDQMEFGIFYDRTRLSTSLLTLCQ